ncbi:unnamed protein product [Paramecium octaurelia]|uniref:Uncharacterized protein n=1 Tax=Paramecium octaurelia TaxID=43137 RepID=A0A8S1T482_PAROT|nr:unnamed protein product [Paramecium octaurelia]
MDLHIDKSCSTASEISQLLHNVKNPYNEIKHIFYLYKFASLVIILLKSTENSGILKLDYHVLGFSHYFISQQVLCICQHWLNKWSIISIWIYFFCLANLFQQLYFKQYSYGCIANLYSCTSLVPSNCQLSSKTKGDCYCNGSSCVDRTCFNIIPTTHENCQGKFNFCTVDNEGTVYQ